MLLLVSKILSFESNSQRTKAEAGGAIVVAGI